MRYYGDCMSEKTAFINVPKYNVSFNATMNFANINQIVKMKKKGFINRTMKEEKYCAECGVECTDEYYMVGDNYLQVKYFDSDDCNVFCSKDCLCRSLSVLNVLAGEVFPY